MAIHKSLPNAELHEPKDISTSPSNAVYLADGAGSGDWTDTVAYGQMKINNNSLNRDIVLSAAVDATLNADGDYVKLNATDLWVTSTTYRSTANIANGSIDLDVAGTYKMNFWIGIQTNTAATTNIAFKYGVNGVLSDTKIIDTFKASGLWHTVHASAIVDNLNDTDTIEIYVASDTAQTLSVSDSVFSASMIKVA